MYTITQLVKKVSAHNYLLGRLSQFRFGPNWSATDTSERTRQTTGPAVCTTSCTRTGRLLKSVTQLKWVQKIFTLNNLWQSFQLSPPLTH